jgi:hypothetical protein
MRLARFIRQICLVLAVALTTANAHGSGINVMQAEADSSTDPGYQYAAVNFAGSTSVVSSGVTYHALSDPGSSTVSTYSGHADTVHARLLGVAGAPNPVTDFWCLTAGGFLDNYVQTWSGPYQYADPPAEVGNNIKIVNNSWVTAYVTDPNTGALDMAANVDAVRRIDYMIRREDLVMTSGAVSPYPTPTPLVWANYNGIAVRGTQGLSPADAAGIGKVHADLWGPKLGNADEASSFETPRIAGYAAALINAAGAHPAWSEGNGSNGLHHEVVKSILMTGTDKTAFSSNGFTSWTSNGVNNLDNVNGAGRVDYNTSLSVLNGGPQSPATVTGATVNSPVVTTANAGWWYEPALSASGTKALVVAVTQARLTNLTATLAWDVTQTEGTFGDAPTLDTTDAGVIFANLDLELRPVNHSGSTYTLGSSLDIAELMSKSTNDNLEHLYFTGTLDPGYYAFVVSNNSNFAWNYGFSYRFSTLAIAEPGTFSLAVAFIVSLCSLRYVRAHRGDGN